VVLERILRGCFWKAISKRGVEWEALQNSVAVISSGAWPQSIGIRRDASDEHLKQKRCTISAGGYGRLPFIGGRVRPCEVIC
jgi:hypothetical protein